MTTNQSPIEPTYKEKVDDILLRAIAKWEAQGRSEDEKWAVRNFETGTMIEAKRQLTTLLLEAENKGRVDELQKADWKIRDAMTVVGEGHTLHRQSVRLENVLSSFADRLAELTKGTHEL